MRGALTCCPWWTENAQRGREGGGTQGEGRVHVAHGAALHPRFWKSRGPGGPRGFMGKGSWGKWLGKKLQAPGALCHSYWEGEQGAGKASGLSRTQGSPAG